MDLNRNHYFIVGIVLFLLGLQFRYVSSFELNEKTSRIVEKRLGGGSTVQNATFASMFSAVQSSNRVVHPPTWLGWSLLSIGGVLFVYTLSMKKPGT